MSGWLSSLPHQIPFRAASAATYRDDTTIEGTFVCTSGDALSGGCLSHVMVFEAMAQLGGGLAFGEAESHAFLSGFDDATLDCELEAGDLIHLRVSRSANLGRLHRFEGTASRGGLEIARARFYLAAAEPQEP